MVRPRAGLVAIAPNPCLGVVVSGGRCGWHPEVLAAAGLGLIGPVIWSSPGGHVSAHAQRGGRDAA